MSAGTKTGTTLLTIITLVFVVATHDHHKTDHLVSRTVKHETVHWKGQKAQPKKKTETIKKYESEAKYKASQKHSK